MGHKKGKALYVAEPRAHVVEEFVLSLGCGNIFFKGCPYVAHGIV